MTDTIAKGDITAAEVATFLKRHPDFLREYPELALSLTLPREQGQTTNLASYQLEVLPVGSDVVLLQRDVAAPPVKIEVPWEGAFRWRVSARDARGLEGLPSTDGLIAVDGAR